MLMKRHTWMQWLVINGAVALSLQAFVASAARADDDEVGRRLGKFGKLSSAEQRKVVNAVSSRMKRAADMTNDSDPLRMAVSQALYGAPVAGDAMKAAKVRLRLYAGLNDWALDNLFAPRPGGVGSCQQQFGLRKSECEALLAAGGQVSLSDASRLGAGQPMNAAPAYQQQPSNGYAQQQPMQGGSRFGRYDSGYHAQPAYAAQQPRPMGQPAWGAQQQQPRPMGQPAWGAQQQRPMPVAQPVRPMAMQPAAPPPPTAQTIAARKAEYERKRQEYLERKKAEMEARKNKVVAVQAGEHVQRGPASAEEAEIAGVEPSSAPAPQPAPVASKAATTKPSKGAPEEVAAAPAEAPKSGSDKAALDNSFLDGLMDDPLGKSK
jgi:hypothetical protein